MVTSIMNTMHALYRWQRMKVLMWKARMSNPLHNGLVGMAVQAITGTGKTHGAIACARVWFNHHGDESRLVIVVPTEALQIQWYSIMVEMRMGNVARQGAKRRYDGFSPVVIVTQNSLKRIVNHRNFLNKQTMYILDEAHKAGAKGCMKQLREANRIGAMQACLAISGTIHRTDGRCIMDITGHDGYHNGERKPHIVYGYRDALKDDVIPPFKIHVYQMSWYDMTYDEQTQYKALTKQAEIAVSNAYKEHGVERNELRMAYNAGLHWVDMANTLYRKRKRLVNSIEMRFTVAEETLMHHASLGHKGILMHESIAGITRIKNIMLDNGLEKPYIYHSGDKPEDWDEATPQELAEWKSYQKNRKGILREWLDPRTEEGIMLSVKSLTEGINVPEMDFNMLLSSANSPTGILQAIGRSLRGNKNDEGQWVDRYGAPIEHKNIYILVQGGTTDADKIQYAQQKGDIPDECFITYNRINGDWVKQAGQHIDASSNIDESYAVTYFDKEVSAYDTFDDEPTEFIAVADDEDEILEFVAEPHDEDTIDSPVIYNEITGEFEPIHKSNTPKKRRRRY